MVALPTSIKSTTRSGCLAKEVFEIPELLEYVLSYLDSGQLLLTYSVSRQFFDVIQGSLKLKRKLGLQPDNPTVVTFPPTYSKANLLLRASDLNIHREPTPSKVIVTISRIGGNKLGILGSRCRAMLVCQPPAQEMKIYPSCCAQDPEWTPNITYEPDVVYAKPGEFFRLQTSPLPCFFRIRRMLLLRRSAKPFFCLRHPLRTFSLQDHTASPLEMYMAPSAAVLQNISCAPKLMSISMTGMAT